jgi:hypothetical protein
MLRRLVEDGWQILYFSAKEEIARALADDIAKGRVQLVELEATALPASEPEPVSDETTDTDLVDDAEESVDDTGDIKDASDVEDAGDVEETGDAGEAGSARTPDDDSLQPPPLF